MLRSTELTPWGKAVKKALIEKDFTVTRLCDELRHRGFCAHKSSLSEIMRGNRGAQSAELILAINEILEIEPEDVRRPA